MDKVKESLISFLINIIIQFILPFPNRKSQLANFFFSKYLFTKHSNTFLNDEPDLSWTKLNRTFKKSKILFSYYSSL